jgi:hypothetical protein
MILTYSEAQIARATKEQLYAANEYTFFDGAM